MKPAAISAIGNNQSVDLGDDVVFDAEVLTSHVVGREDRKLAP